MGITLLMKIVRDCLPLHRVDGAQHLGKGAPVKLLTSKWMKLKLVPILYAIQASLLN